MLDALLRSDRLSDREEEAFQGMRNRLGPNGLSKSQRDWVQDRYRAYELDSDDVENLVSTGQIPDAEKVLPKFDWEKMPKPLKPPPRKV